MEHTCALSVWIRIPCITRQTSAGITAFCIDTFSTILVCGTRHTQCYTFIDIYGTNGEKHSKFVCKQWGKSTLCHSKYKYMPEAWPCCYPPSHASSPLHLCLLPFPVNAVLQVQILYDCLLYFPLPCLLSYPSLMQLLFPLPPLLSPLSASSSYLCISCHLQ